MSENSIEAEIISIIADVSGFDVEEISPDSKLADDLEIDSIKAIEIVVALEKKYKISVRDEDVPKITTVQETTELVTTLLKQENMTHVRTS
jgi:acyl carrier protein